MSQMKAYMLTTKDNPYDPSTDFIPWYMFDMEKGYDSCGAIARLAQTSDQLTDVENAREIERAIDRIIELDFRDIYKKIEFEEELPTMNEEDYDAYELTV